MKPLLLLVLALPALGADPVRIVAPAADAPAIGERIIEIETSAEAVDRVEIRVDGRLAGVLRTPPYRLPFDFGPDGQAHRIEAEVFSAGYSERRRADLVTVGTEQAHVVDFVEVPLRLRSSRPVSAAELGILENGAEHEARDLRPDRGPTRFVFVVDRSLSMQGEPIDAALDAIRSVVPRFREGDSAEVVLFNHRVARPVAVNEANREASGGTALRDALASIQPSARTVAIVISDGGDRNSFLDRQTALEAIAVSPLSVHALVLGRGEGAAFLRDVASRTGGSFRSTRARDLSRDLGAVFDDVDSRWTLAYQSSNHGRGWRSIEIRPNAPGIVVEAAREGYFAR